MTRGQVSANHCADSPLKNELSNNFFYNGKRKYEQGGDRMALNLDAIGRKIGPVTKDYTWKDVVLYALGVGAGFDELDYCFEQKLKVIPSFSIASVFEFLAEVGLSSNADLSGILHGEQDIIFHNPFPTEGTITTEGTLTNMFDKGKGKDFENGKLDFNELYKMAMEHGEIELQSGKQELFENIVNQYI